MPTSDLIFSVIGAADYIFLLLFIAATGFIARRKAHAAEKQNSAATQKPAS